MSEWVDTTVRRILDLKPRRVLEIGCGTGLILFRVAPTCASYSGTDISKVALEGIRRQLDSRQVALPQVTLSQRAAHELGEFEPNGFDTVILNSVTQLFPSVEYLLDVLERVIDLVEPGGRVFVGDVRSLPHLEMLHTSIQLFQSPGSLPREQLRARVKKSMTQEEQLVVAPEFFFALADHLPKISGVGLQLRGGWHHNELTRFRYDVVLEIGERIKPEGDVSVLDWSTDDVGLVGIRQYLSERAPATLILRGVPNARLSAEVRMLELVHDPEGLPTVADVRRELKEVHKGGAVDPEEIWALAGDHPYEIQVAWADSGELGACDVTFTRRADRKVGSRLVPPPGRFPFSPKPWSQYANRPVLGKAAQTLPPRLRAFLAERLPDYMVPSAFVLLDALPLSPNGKVDMRALQPPDATRPPLSEPYVAPLNQVEEAIAGIWGDVLGIERVGRHDQFLELGGHSLLAMQVASRLEGLFSLELSLGSVLSSPTVAVLASCVQRAGERAGIDVGEIARRAVRPTK
jgi:SAM-dependent methyltransferase